MPDDHDYEWLGRLLAHPEAWTDEDLSTVRFMIGNQKQAVDQSHAKDVKRRQRLQEVVDELEAALQKHLASRGS
jgi:hypothetical protein